MVLPSGNFTSKHAWPDSLRKAQNEVNTPRYRSYNFFQTRKQEPQYVSEIMADILTSKEEGREVDIERFADFIPAPSKSEWEHLREMGQPDGVDVRRMISKVDLMQDLLGGILIKHRSKRDGQIRYLCDE